MRDGCLLAVIEGAGLKVAMDPAGIDGEAPGGVALLLQPAQDGAFGCHGSLRDEGKIGTGRRGLDEVALLAQPADCGVDLRQCPPARGQGEGAQHVCGEDRAPLLEMLHRPADRMEGRGGLPVGGIPALKTPALAVEPGVGSGAVAGDAPVAGLQLRHAGLPDAAQFLA